MWLKSSHVYCHSGEIPRARQISSDAANPTYSGRTKIPYRQLILHEKQFQRVLNEYVAYFNRARPHQGIQHHDYQLVV
jgi:hypothetical protein